MTQFLAKHSREQIHADGQYTGLSCAETLVRATRNQVARDKEAGRFDNASAYVKLDMDLKQVERILGQFAAENLNKLKGIKY